MSFKKEREITLSQEFHIVQCRRLGPGVYNVEENGFHPKAVEERTKGPGWARQYEVERIAAMPHLLFKDQWLERHTLVSAYIYINDRKVVHTCIPKVF